MNDTVGNITQLTTDPKPTAISDFLGNAMDRIYAEGFEMGKIRAQQMIAKRVEWLWKEAHAGGNWEYLKNKAEEAAYMGEKIAALKLTD